MFYLKELCFHISSNSVSNLYWYLVLANNQTDVIVLDLSIFVLNVDMVIYLGINSAED